MRRSLLLGGVACWLSAMVLLAPPVTSAASDALEGRAKLASVRLPFIANQGQLDARVAYYAPTFAGTFFITRRGELVYALGGPRIDPKPGRGRRVSGHGWSLTETLLGGRARPVAQDRSAAGVSAFLGDDPARWRASLSAWEQVSLGEVWPGVSVAVRAQGQSMEKVFTVHPGGRVSRIRLRVAGAEALTVNADRALVASTGLGAVTFTAPVAYQERDGVRHPVAVAYRQRGFEYGFSVGVYDPKLPLVIDPLLGSTYLGGNGNETVFALAVHPTTGDVYAAGSTFSSNFPGTAGGAQPTLGGSMSDAFVARLSSALTVVQATYLGSSGVDEAFALAIHPTTGDVYVAGSTFPFIFPGITKAFPGTAGGAQPATGGFYDAFVVRLPASLTSLTQATFLGGTGYEQALALAIHPATGDVYVAGQTSSNFLPGTVGGAQSVFGDGIDAFVARFSSTLTTLTQATYLGGRTAYNDARALAIHPSTGDVYVAGITRSNAFPATAGGAQPEFGGDFDAFVARLPSSLTSLTQATYFGGTNADHAFALAIHPTTGDVYAAGSTNSSPLPGTAGGAQPAIAGDDDLFVARFSSTLTSLIQATYVGGSGFETGYALAIHPTTGEVYVTGSTTSSLFPATAGGARPTIASSFDAFVARLSSTLTSLAQATYVGGAGFYDAYTLAIAPLSGNVYVGGATSAPAGAALGGSEAVVSRLTFGLASVDPSRVLSASVNQSAFAVGQTLVAGGAVINLGSPASADVYVGLVRPDGSIQFFTSGGIVVGHVTDLASFRPLAVAVPLATPFTVRVPDFYTHEWTAGDPRGSYVFFVGAVATGALATGTLTSNQILGLATAPFSFP